MHATEGHIDMHNLSETPSQNFSHADAEAYVERTMQNIKAYQLLGNSGIRMKEVGEALRELTEVHQSEFTLYREFVGSVLMPCNLLAEVSDLYMAATA
jgi:hypothetical protein